MGSFEEHLAKIAHAEKEKRVGILLFPINILLQHGVILVPAGSTGIFPSVKVALKKYGSRDHVLPVPSLKHRLQKDCYSMMNLIQNVISSDGCLS